MNLLFVTVMALTCTLRPCTTSEQLDLARCQQYCEDPVGQIAEPTAVGLKPLPCGATCFEDEPVFHKQFESTHCDKLLKDPVWSQCDGHGYTREQFEQCRRDFFDRFMNGAKAYADCMEAAITRFDTRSRILWQ